jgi:ribosomal protein S18 acetylase RimI-like enzyme
MSDKDSYFGKIRNLIEVFWKKVIRNINDYGLSTSIKKIISFIFKSVYNKKAFIIYELDLTKGSEKVFQQNEYKFKLLEAEDASLIKQIEEMEEWLKGVIQKRLSKNAICMVVLKDQKVAGFNLVSVGEVVIPLIKLRVITKPDEVWSEQITIHKDHRRKGLASLLRSQLYKELNKKGFKALYGHRQEWNIVSHKAVRKYILQELVRAEYIKILNHQRLRYTKLSSDPLIKNNKEAGIKDLKSRTNIEYHYVKPPQKEEQFYKMQVSDLKA